MDKVMPQNIEAEQAVLGSVLIDPETIHELRYLKDTDFYREVHRVLWRVLQKMSRQGIPTSILLVGDELQRAGQLEAVGGQGYLATLHNAVPTSADAPYYGKIVKRCARNRQLVHAAGQIAALAYNEEGDSVTQRRKVYDLISEVYREETGGGVISLAQALDALFEETYKRMEGDLAQHLLKTMWEPLDEALTGLEPGNLVYICGRPGSGKSSMGLDLLLVLLEQLRQRGETVDYINLEMTVLEQGRRLIAKAGDVTTKQIRRGFRNSYGDIQEEELAAFSARLEDLKKRYGETLYLSEEPMTVDDLREHLAQVVTSRHCRVAVVDQLDLFSDDERKDEEAQISYISKTLKQIARSLHITVICLVQLNRSLEARARLIDRRPRLADLRYSGRLEQDPDIVLGVVRYCQYEERPDASWQQYAQLGTLKVRDGVANEWIDLFYDGPHTSFDLWPKDWPIPALEPVKEGK